MAETIYFPRRLILAGAMISGVLLALAVHMLGARYGLDLGGLWRSDKGTSCRRVRRSRGGCSRRWDFPAAILPRR